MVFFGRCLVLDRRYLRGHLGPGRAASVYAPKYGSLRLVVTRNRHSNHEYVATNDLQRIAMMLNRATP